MTKKIFSRFFENLGFLRFWSGNRDCLVLLSLLVAAGFVELSIGITWRIQDFWSKISIFPKSAHFWSFLAKIVIFRVFVHFWSFWAFLAKKRHFRDFWSFFAQFWHLKSHFWAYFDILKLIFDEKPGFFSISGQDFPLLASGFSSGAAAAPY